MNTPTPSEEEEYISIIYSYLEAVDSVRKFSKPCQPLMFYATIFYRHLNKISLREYCKEKITTPGLYVNFSSII